MLMQVVAGMVPSLSGVEEHRLPEALPLALESSLYHRLVMHPLHNLEVILSP